MATNSKLTRVLEYLTQNKENEARELLHNVFIEKARAIHEELMNMDEEQNEFGTGDQGQDLKNEITAMEDEIDFEQTMGEDDGEENFEMPTDDGMDGMDSEMTGDEDGEMMPDGEPMNPPGDMEVVADKMHDLEDALAALKAEFERTEDGDEMPGEEDTGEEIPGEEEPDMSGDEGNDQFGSEKEEEPVDETSEWELDEDFDDLAESLDLEVITNNMANDQKTTGEVGSGKSGMAIDKSAKSPLPSSQKDRMGAKPVVVKSNGHTGYSLESAPKSEKLPILPTDNRRKKAENDTSKVSKEGDGAALLNHPIPTTSKNSPLSDGGKNLKSL